MYRSALVPPTWGTVKYGTVSSQLTLRLSAAPATALTVTPSGHDLVFEPATVTFAKDATAANVTVKGRNAGTRPVAFAFGGVDAGNYAAFDSVQANAVVVARADVVIGAVPDLEVFQTSTAVTACEPTANAVTVNVTVAL